MLKHLQIRWHEYLSTQAGRTELSQLGLGVSKAIATVRVQGNPQGLRAAPVLSMLINVRLRIAKLTGSLNDLDPEAIIALREFVQREIERSKKSEPRDKSELNATLLLAWGEVDGFNAIPLDALLQLACSPHPLNEEGQRLVDSLFEARPEEFRAYFVSQIEELRDNYSDLDLWKLFGGRASLYRSSRESSGLWDAIIKQLAVDEVSRQRCKSAMQELVKRTSFDDVMKRPLQVLESLLRQ